MLNKPVWLIGDAHKKSLDMPDTQTFTSRQYFSVIFITIILLLAGAAYFQFVEDLQPCNLCLLQRLTFIAIAIILLFAILHHPQTLGIQIYSVVTLLFSTLGIVIAGRQVWLQYSPSSQMPSCGPSLHFMINNLPPSEAVQILFKGTADCAKADWHLFGLSFAVYALIAFAIITLLMIRQLIKPTPIKVKAKLI